MFSWYVLIYDCQESEFGPVGPYIGYKYWNFRPWKAADYE